MAALTTPTLQELKEFYPTTGSLEPSKIEEVTNFVKSNIFLEMFGFQAATQIIDGTVDDSASNTFLGFQKFLALCVAYQQERDPLMSTNFGSKVISRPNVTDPTNNQKSITLVQLEKTISIHYKEALKIVNNKNCANVPTWGGYFSYAVKKL
jgi:hypothetical protein